LGLWDGHHLTWFRPLLQLHCNSLPLRWPSKVLACSPLQASAPPWPIVSPPVSFGSHRCIFLHSWICYLQYPFWDGVWECSSKKHASLGTQFSSFFDIIKRSSRSFRASSRRTL
jgi:hypothetical protein